MRHYLLYLLLFLSFALSAQCLVEAELLSTSCIVDIERYTAEFEVRGVNPGTAGGFEVTDIEGNVLGSGTYPGIFTSGSFLIGQDILLLFADTSTTGCHDTIQLVSPDCPNVDCEIIVFSENTFCDDIQEVYYLETFVDNLNNNNNSGWVATDEQGQILGEGVYGTTFTFGPFDGGTTARIFFEDIDNIACQLLFETDGPDCSVEECILTAQVVATQCDPTQNVFFMDIIINGMNLESWVATNQFGQFVTQGNYDETTTFGPFPANTNVRLIFTDANEPDCSFLFEAQAPQCELNPCGIEVEFLENECTLDGSGVFFRFTVNSTEDGTWEALQINMTGQSNTGQIFRAGPFGPDFGGRVNFSLSDVPECSITRDLPAATCPEFPCFGFRVDAGPALPTFCESGDVWEFIPVNGTYPMSIEIFTVPSGFRVVLDSLFAPGIYGDFLDQGDYRVVLTDVNGCIAEQDFFVEANFCSSLQGRSWLDTNRNGIQDVSETVGVSAEVLLLNEAGDIEQVAVASQNGFFFFSNLLEGSYMLQFSPIGQEVDATTPFVGDDECRDSNIDQNSWTTLPFQVNGGDQLSCIDAGWIESNCDSLFISLDLEHETTSCGDIPNIIVNFFSADYPVEVTLFGNGNEIESRTLEAEEQVVFTATETGFFAVLITNSLGCAVEQGIDVEEIQGLNVVIEQTGSICTDDDPATLTAIVPNVDPVNLFYEWSTGETTSSITDLVVFNTYAVTVTDQTTGCFGSEIYVANGNQNDSLFIIEEPFVIGCDMDSVYVSIDSIQDGYTYRWFGPLNQIFDGPGFWAVMPGFYYLEAFGENGCSFSGQAEVVGGSLEDINPILLVFPNDSICAEHNCIRLIWEGPFFGTIPGGVDVLWETPNPVTDSIANANPFGTLCTFYPGLHRVTITTECDTIVRSVVLDDPRGCSSISGQLWVDQAADCDLDPEDTPVPNYVLMLTNEDTGEMYYVMTDANGFWQLEVPEGSYTVVPSLAPGSPFGTCDPAASVTLGNLPVTGVNVFMPAIASCPQLTTTVAMPFLRRCFNNTAWVEYENRGTATAINGQVTVTLDDFFEDVTAVPAPVSQDGQTYTFNVGDIAPFQQGLIFFHFRVSCDAEIGQNHCVEASITPDAPCDPDPLWDGALVNVDAVGCNGDSVLFRITNIGVEQMSVPLSYVIVEDGIMLFAAPQVNGLLMVGEVMDIMLPANGSTYHVITNQEPNAPANPEPTAVLEGCNGNGGNGFSTGFGNILNLANGPLTTSTVCRENRGAYDPNDKYGYPLGYGAQNFIPEGTRLDYAIRFQNTGTDTAFTVIIRDTIPESLDLATIKMDAASHPYTVSLDTHRVLSFVFENILLPDSSVNLAGSQGVVNFSIDHAVGLQPGDVILNEAAIYFDFNEPIITNLSRHTIDKDGLPTGTRNQLAQQVAVGIFPNPSTGRINVRIPDQRIQATDLLLITDIYGRQLAKANYASAANGWDVSHLPAGYYLVVVTDRQGRAMGRAGFVVSK
ncbi:DUF7619 domain-containing protein [Neolewinella persica]|uniref:DUF7619 domain-containing protein n=1 Tax=Neolewinella persica TaxID=70998 RepID=UPI00036C6BCE|nr:SdrD B-like domain-containing protein [Neolewinella persica]